MSIVYEERASDSPYVETVTHGWTLREGETVRPAESHWHMVFVKHHGSTQALVVGSLTTAGIASWGADAEILWIKFKLGTFIPHLPVRDFLNVETPLPAAASRTFWLKGSAWQLPSYDNVETFIDRLVRDDALMRDPVVSAALKDQPLQALSSRTLRHRFLHATGVSHNHIRQVERAQQAAALLVQGVSILDVVDQLGYFDQPHLTKALKRFTGYTPAQMNRVRSSETVSA